MTNMSLAGWSVNQTLSGIDGVLQLAAASNMDLADASQIVTDNISTFNLEASVNSFSRYDGICTSKQFYYSSRAGRGI